jgi:hypothetical protein
MSDKLRFPKDCPKCRCMIYRENDTLFCLNAACDWESPARRVKDKEVPTIETMMSDPS